MTEIMTLKKYNGREGAGTFRAPASIEEMAAHCSAHSHIWILSNHGDARRVKVNGAVRRWKRNPNRIEVPVKYGMYEYGTFTQHDLGRVLIEVELLHYNRGIGTGAVHEKVVG